MSKKQKIAVILGLIAIAGIFFYFYSARDSIRMKRVKEITSGNNGEAQSDSVFNNEQRSPVSGLVCDNWKRRPLAVMQPGDETARPAAGFSEADMVIEMPVITSSVTRLMGVYICNTPDEVGSMRSARHDFIHLAKGLDAIFVPWGRSESHSGSDSVGLAQGILNRNEIDNINCNQDAGKSSTLCSDNPCFRKNGMLRGVDSGYANPSKLLTCAEELGYRMENTFPGYPHQEEAPASERPDNGNLRVAFGGVFAVEYDYDKATNSYLRIWGKKEDMDRNNNERIAPKNVVVMIARSEQIEGQYNNIQLGDPWYDETDSGQAYYFFNGKEQRGNWKKSRSDISSKLFFYDENGKEIKFVPGQIWVEVLEPGQNLEWETGSDLAEQEAVENNI